MDDNEEAKKTAALQIRTSKELRDYIRQQSEQLQISQNAVIVVLIELGRKIWDAGITMSLQEK